MKLKLTGSSIRCNGKQHRPPAVIDTEVLGISDAEAAVLVRRGVAVHYEEEVAQAAPVAPAGAEVIKLDLGKKEDAPAVLEGTLAGVADEAGNVVPLEKMKKDELLQIAKDMEIEGADGMTKAQLVEAIQAAKVLVPADGDEQANAAGADGKDSEAAGQD